MPRAFVLEGRPITEHSPHRHFFRSLRPLDSFEQAADLNFHTDLPSDWWVIVTDVVNSTNAIRQGKYKDVNTTGASTIIAVINTDRSVELPYVFGGDGANLAVPPEMELAAREALLGAKEMALSAFGLELRTGMVRVSELQAQSYWVKVGKYRQSEHIDLATFSGSGWATAERWVKDESTRAAYEVRASDTLRPNASFEGFECRWQSVRSNQDHKLCLLVASMAASPSEHAAIYRRVMAKVSEIYGDAKASHPLTLANLELTLNPWRLLGESKVRTQGKSFWSLFSYLAIAIITNRIGRWLFSHHKDTKQVQWSKYRDDMIRNADTRKFDGILKMVVDGTDGQFERLQKDLEDLYHQNLIAYGTHRSKEALITCLIFSYNGKHAHFVDGADGGYALAAVELKARLQLAKRGTHQDSLESPPQRRRAL